MELTSLNLPQSVPAEDGGGPVGVGQGGGVVAVSQQGGQQVGTGLHQAEGEEQQTPAGGLLKQATRVFPSSA